MKRITALALAALMSASTLMPLNALAEGRYYGEPDDQSMIVDTFLVRPLGLAASLAGAVTWVVSAPFSITGGNAQEAADEMVGKPLNHTFNRPLGDFSPEDNQ